MVEWLAFFIHYWMLFGPLVEPVVGPLQDVEADWGMSAWVAR